MMRVARAFVDEKKLAAVCERYGVAELQVFGSAARGDATVESDVDILYTLQPERKLGWNIEQLTDELSELFGRPVDLISRRALHARLRPAVLADARQLYAA